MSFTQPQPSSAVFFLQSENADVYGKGGFVIVPERGQFFFLGLE